MTYFNGFNVMRIDADSIPVTLVSTTLNVRVYGGASLGTVTVDEFGYVESQSLAASSGTVVQFQHATYPLKFLRTLADSIDEAVELFVNISPGFVVQDLSTATREAIVYEMWVQNDDVPEAADRFLGFATAGATTSFGYESVSNQHLTVYGNPLTSNGERKYLSHRFAKPSAVFVASSLPDPGPSALNVVSLFDHYGDAPTTGTIEETLYSNTVAANQFAAGGDKIAADYSGVFAATGTNKRIKLYFDGVSVFDSGVVTENNKHWNLKVTFTRVSNTVIRAVALFASAVSWQPTYTALTGLDLSTANDIDLKATDGAGGNTVAKVGHAVFIPGVNDYVTYLGEIVTYLGEPLTYGT